MTTSGDTHATGSQLQAPDPASQGRRSFQDTLGLLFKARFPVLYIESFEEARVEREVAAVASDLERVRTPRPLWTWSLTRGVVGTDGKSQSNTTDPLKALDWILNHSEPGVFIFRDLHAHLGDGSGRAADAGLVRRIRDVAAAFQSGVAARALLIVAPILRIPPELEKDITIIDFPLPGEIEIRAILENMMAISSDQRDRSA